MGKHKKIKIPQFLYYIKVQITLYYLVVSMIFVSLFGVVLYYSISDIVLQDTLEKTSIAVERSGNYIEVYIEKLKTIAGILVNNPRTKAYLGEHDGGSIHDINSLINDAIASDPFLSSIVIVSKDGRVLSNEQSLDMTISEDMMDEPWYVAAIQNNRMPVLTSARMQKFSMEKEDWVVSISQEITDDDGNNIGVLLIDIKYQVLEDFLKKLSLGTHGFAFILNDHQEVVYHENTNYFQNDQKRQELIEISNMKDGYDHGLGMLTQHYHLKNTDWTLVGVSSLDGLQTIRRQIIETIIGVALILLVLTTIIGVFIAGRIIQPIRELEQVMSDIENGLMRVTISEKRCYEATSLAKHYNIMVDRIQELMEEITKKEKYLRKYEINSLYSQINPHFLYNTLDTIVWMAEFDDKDKIISLTKALAKFFRLTLNNGEELVTIEDEVDHVRQYLYIQKQRYMDKLSYSIYIEETTKNIKVPKIILQPIVENAIYHGIKELEDSGHIWISVREKGENIIFSIRDNGVGFMIDQSQLSKVKLGGIGIHNVDKRIKLYYGDDYGVDIDSKLNQGTKVTITIPRKVSP